MSTIEYIILQASLGNTVGANFKLREITKQLGKQHIAKLKKILKKALEQARTFSKEEITEILDTSPNYLCV